MPIQTRGPADFIESFKFISVINIYPHLFRFYLILIYSIWHSGNDFIVKFIFFYFIVNMVIRWRSPFSVSHYSFGMCALSVFTAEILWIVRFLRATWIRPNECHVTIQLIHVHTRTAISAYSAKNRTRRAQCTTAKFYWHLFFRALSSRWGRILLLKNADGMRGATVIMLAFLLHFYFQLFCWTRQKRQHSNGLDTHTDHRHKRPA